jgi:competence protein ComEA
MEAVIKLAGLGLAPSLTGDPRIHLPLRPGEFMNILIAESQVVEFERNWLPALQRMALGIALHPDCMNYDDWQALSGVGPRLAQRIEDDRQQNGDFGSLDGLKRVRGIGPRSIEGWKKFF